MSDSAFSLIAEGKQLHSDNKLSEAARKYRQALEREPGNAEAAHMLGLVHFQRGELEEAEDLIRTAIAGEADASRLHCNLGAVLMAVERYPEARASFETALELDSGDPDARYNLALALQALGRHEDAISQYRGVLEAQPDSLDVKLNLGTACREAGQLQESENLFMQLLEQAPELAPLHFNLGLTLKQAGQWQRAAAALQRSLELDAGNRDALYALAATLTGAGDTAAAADHYGQLRAAVPALERLDFTFGTVLLELGDTEAAVQALTAALDADAGNRDARYALGLAELRRGHGAAALSAFEHNLKTRPAAGRELAHKVIALAMLGREEALAALADGDRLIAMMQPQTPAEAGGEAGFAGSLAALISGHPELQPSRPGAITENGSLLYTLLENTADEPLVSLVALLEAAVDDYLAERPRDSEHPLLAQRPGRKQLLAWGQVLSPGGRQRPHIRERAWLSGIYFLRVPGAVHEDDAGHAGWLEIGGCDDSVYELKTPPARRLVCPREGLLVLFPAWFQQQILPLPDTGECVSIGFDVIAAQT